MNLENLQLAETAGASPEDHLSGRFKVPDGFILVPLVLDEMSIYATTIEAAPKFSQSTKQNPVTPDGYALIKQEPDAELLERMRNLINNFLVNDAISKMESIAIYKFISGYAPKHNQD